MDIIYLILILLQQIIIISSQNCHRECEECFEASEDDKDMKCKSCKYDGYYLLYNTTNCVFEGLYNDYYKNETNEYTTLYPCSYYNEGANCYECDPFNKSEDGGICISCKFGYYYNNETKKCSKCLEGQLTVVLSDFDNCNNENQVSQYCDKYETLCFPFDYFNFTCPSYAPIFNNITKTCSEMDCPEEGFKNGECQIKIQKYKDRILFINWFKGRLSFPSYNNDNSGLLLIEYTPNIEFIIGGINIKSSDQRQLYFYNEEGRGCFNEINDEYNKLVNLDNKYFRFFSTSLAIKVNDEDKYEYFLNFEYSKGNLELINIKTGEISYKNLFSLVNINNGDYGESSHLFPIIFLLETNDKNKYLLGFFIRTIEEVRAKTGIVLIFFRFISSNKTSVINIDSIDIITIYMLLLDISENSKVGCIQTKNDYFILTMVNASDFLLSYILDPKMRIIDEYYIFPIIPKTFLKRVFLKDEKSLIVSHAYDYGKINLIILVQDIKFETFENLIFSPLLSDLNYGILYYTMDMIALTEKRVIILSQQLHGRTLQICVFDFLNNYSSFVVMKFFINIINQKNAC